MRAGMQALVDLLRGQDVCCALGDGDWAAMLALAEEEHVSAWAADRLRAQCKAMTAERASEVDAISRDAAIAAFYWSCQLKSLLHGFADAEIDVVPLKGPLLAERIYGSVALRGCRDLDLLVGSADVARAETLLAGLGFIPGEPDDYHRGWSRRGTRVELHRDVENPLAFDFDVASALRRAKPAEFQGEPCMRFAREDELLFLCLHAARHRYERLSLIVDLRLAFEKLAANADSWMPRAETAELDGLMALGVAMVRRLEPEFCLTIDLRIPRRHAGHLETVADGLWKRLMMEESKPLNWRALHDFFVEMEGSHWLRMRRRWRHWRILASRLIEADAIFAARFGLHRAWQARLLRPARLISESVRGRAGER